jgi:hypothetical protein
MDRPSTGCFTGAIRVFSKDNYVDDDARRRRIIAKNQLLKRLHASLNDWQYKRSRIDRRTTAKASTLMLLKKAKTSKRGRDSDDSMLIDPITREDLTSAVHIFTFKRGDTVARVDASSLIDYILSTGDFCDPESRLPFDDDALKRLDAIAQKLGKPSILRARNDVSSKLGERHFVRDALCGLERVCGDSVTQMFELVEAVHERRSTLDEAQITLLSSVLPEFQNSFSQLAQADKAYARHSAEEFEAFLRGPPNKPVKPSTIHNIVMDLFLSTVNEAVVDQA